MLEKVTVRPTKHERYSHVVRWPAGGKRIAKLFANETDALKFAKDRKAELGEVGEAFGSITEAERGAVMFWRGFVASVPDTPPPALLTLLQEHAERHKATKSSVTVAVAVAAYEAAKTAEGLRQVSLQTIHARCGRFAADFGTRTMASITASEISDWILSLPAARQPVQIKRKSAKEAQPMQVGLLAKRNHRLALSGLFNYAKSRGWVRENPVIDAARPKPPKTRPGILHPGDVARLFTALETTSPALVAFWGIRFFAGVREQEALRMDWGMVDLAAGEINLPDTVTKTGHSRTVKIEPALSTFLAPRKQKDGAIVTSSAMGRTYHLRKALRVIQAEDAVAAAKAKADGNEPPRPFPVPMPPNAARHCFATFHLLAFRHAGETALQLGHGGSPEMLHRHYKGIATEAEAHDFWAIRPATPADNVVPMTSPAEAAEAKSKTRRKAR